MKKTAGVINFILVFVMALSAIPIVRVDAENASWKSYLSDFLTNSFPSLFDEATKKKNEDIFEKWLNNPDYTPNSFEIPIDALGKWENTNPYCPLLLPSTYKFYDLDNDGVPEVIVTYPTPWAEGHYDFIYKLNGEKYEQIYSEYQSVYFYTNAQNELVMFEGFYTDLNAVCFAEIKNGELILSDYIDSKGSDIYNGFKYDYLGGDFSYPHEDGSMGTYQAGLDSSILGAIVQADALTPLPQFDCSDVVESLKYISVSPKTGSTNIIVFMLPGLISTALFCIHKKSNECTKKVI